MTYRPTERVFLPPWSARIPSLIYLGATSGLLILALAASQAGPGSLLGTWFTAASTNRVMSPTTFALLLWVSAAASVGRMLMRGVRVLEDGLEYRDVVSWMWPRRRKYRWPQMDCIVLDQPTQVALDLWNGTRAFLPSVEAHGVLCATLTRVALARAIPVRGAVELDDLPGEDDLPDSSE